MGSQFRPNQAGLCFKADWMMTTSVVSLHKEFLRTAVYVCTRINRTQDISGKCFVHVAAIVMLLTGTAVSNMQRRSFVRFVGLHLTFKLLLNLF